MRIEHFFFLFTRFHIDFGMIGKRLRLGAAHGVLVIVEHKPVGFITAVIFQIYVQARAQYQEHCGYGRY